MTEDKREKYKRFYEIRDAVFFDLETAKKLIAEDPTIVQSKNSLGETPLHFLVVENALGAVKFLYENGASINTSNEFGNSAIAEAVSLKYYDMVDMLLTLGAEPNIDECFGERNRFSLSEDEINKFLDIFEKHGYKC